MNKKHLLALLCFLCAAVAAYADGAFRNHRYDTFKVEPINEQSIVFVGNSITDMHLWSEAFGNDPRVVNRGNSGGLSSEILANVKSYCAGHPAKIFLMIGTNDGPSASTAPTIVGNIEKTIKAIQTESPKTEIYIESLLPSSNNRSNTGISAVNTAIQEMLKGYPTVTYVDLYSKLVGKCDNKTSGYSLDALHLTAAGYQVWLAEIEKYMGDLKSVYPTNTVSLQNVKSTGNSHDMRTTYFTMMPLTSSDVLFFGEEMVKNGEWGELLRNQNVKNRGTGWGYEGTYNVMSVVSQNVDATFASVNGITKQEPKQVLLYTGTGEINAGTGVATVFSNYKKVVEKIRGYAPNAKISLVSLMPTRTYNNNARVKQFNEQLLDYAANTENVEYIDIYSTLAATDGQPKDEYFPVSNDNYIYGDGYIAIAQVLSRYIDGCNPVTAKEAEDYRDLILGIGENDGPETIDYIIDNEHGYLQRGDGTIDANWNTYWYSDDEPQLEFNAGVNNMTWADNDVQMETGSANGATYTFRAPQGYLIKDVKFTAVAKTAGKTVTLNFDGETYTTSTAGQTFEKTDVNKANFSFSLSGNNGNSTLLKDATVTVIRKDLVVIPVDPFAEPEAFTVFATPQSGGVPYRIPAICTTADGTLVAIADYRYSRQDIGSGRIDLHIRRSLDNGETWEKEIIKPYEMEGRGALGNGNDHVGFGDPCIVADRESGRILVLSCAGYPGFFQCTYDQHQRCARWYSDDNGLTWSEPEFIDMPYIFEPLNAATGFGPAQGMFFGSGKIHQSRYVKVDKYYRLYAANSVRNASGVIRNYVMYSDDFGETWQFLGGVNNPAVFSSGDEPKCEELPNGHVLFSGRINGQGGRHYNIFQFTDIEKAEGKWMGVAVSNTTNNGIMGNNATNGEIQLVPVINKETGDHHYLALQSAPWGPGRNNVGIQWKALDEGTDYNTPANFAKKWEGQHQVSETTSCYSTMSVQKNHTIGFLYEENSKNSGYDIQYKNYTIECLTGGKYTYDTEYVPVIEMQPIQAMSYAPAPGIVESLETIDITFNNEMVSGRSIATVAEGINAKFSLNSDRPRVVTATLTKPVTEPGTYTLTFPAGVFKDINGQTNDEFSVTYRILAEEKPLGTTITSLDEVDNHKVYALYNPHFTAYAIYAPEQNETAVWTANMIGDASHQLSNTAYGEKCNFADPNTSWMLVSHEDQYYLYNVGAQQFVNVGRPTAFVEEAKPILVEEISGGFAFNTTGKGQEYMCAAPQLGQPISVWTSDDDGSCWQLIENPNIEDDYANCIHLIDPSVVVGLNTVTIPATESYYDIQGRRLQGLPTRRGLYIVGNRKVVR